MNREEITAALFNTAEQLAKEYNCPNRADKVSNANLIYGEDARKVMAQINGREGVEWTNEAGDRVEFRFRFMNPCINVRLADHRFCEIEFAKEGGEFQFAESLVVKKGGFALQERIFQVLKNNGVEK